MITGTKPGTGGGRGYYQKLISLFQWKRLIIISISVIIGILLAKTYLRLFKPQITFDRLPDTGTGCYQPDQELFAVPKPNTVCTLRTPDYTMETPINPQGFVGSEEIPMEKYPDRPRIAFIGDSFTCGQGVYHFMAYPAVIGSMLRGKHIPVEVINASMVGSGPDWYYCNSRTRWHSSAGYRRHRAVYWE